MEKINHLEEKKRIDMETQRQASDKKLADSKVAAANAPASLTKRLSKRAKKKLDKQLSDKNVSEIEKKLLLE